MPLLAIATAQFNFSQSEQFPSIDDFSEISPVGLIINFSRSEDPIDVRILRSEISCERGQSQRASFESPQASNNERLSLARLA